MDCGFEGPDPTALGAMKTTMGIHRFFLTSSLLLGTALPAAAGNHEVAGEFSIADAIAGSWRSDADRSRDAARHPAETLEFFGLEPSMTVVEISPGGAGWYTKILAPFVNRTGGRYIAAGYDPSDTSDYARRGYKAFQETFVEAPETYGKIEVTIAGPDSPGVAPPGSADLVVTFRNVHNWVPGGYAEKLFADMFRALKPGGVLGVVDHRLPADREAPEDLRTGYIHEAVVIRLAEKAGFVFEAASAVNANPKDTADHPFGVWTLPPTALTSDFGEPADPSFDRTPYDAIGESDRFTLRFRRPR
jgi:predicted methyltransferase